MMLQALREVKWTLGNILTAIGIFVVITGSFITAIKWVKGTDKDIKINKTMTKDNKKEIEELQRCERDANESIAKMEVLLQTLGRRTDRLEYKIDGR